MEHDESPVSDGGKGFLQLVVEGAKTGLQRGFVHPVDACPHRVQSHQGVGHGFDDHRRVDRVQPQVQVVFAFAVLVSVLTVHVGGPVFIVVRGGMLFVVVARGRVGAIGTMLGFILPAPAGVPVGVPRAVIRLTAVIVLVPYPPLSGSKERYPFGP